MKQYQSIENAISQGSGKVNLRGWVYRIRNSNKFVFIVLRDQSDIIQCVVKKESTPELYDQAVKLTMESSIMLTGEIKKDERAPTGY